MNPDRTQPHERCAYCGINANAVPDEPPVLFAGALYHRRGCYPAARLVAGGFLPEDHEAWTSAPVETDTTASIGGCQ